MIGLISIVLTACAGGESADEAGIERLDGSRIGIAALEADIVEIMRAARLPGLQVAVIADGEIAYSSGFGVREAGTTDPVGPETVFAALSFSKTMFAYLVARLVDEGVLDLDAPMVSYLPKPLHEYEFYADLAGEERVGLLTPRMALSHTTGFPNWRWFTPDGRLSFVYEPGTRHGYSGEGIFLLQLAVEEATGRGLEDLAQEKVFRPLGMSRSSFVFLAEFEADHATDHDHYLNPIGKERRDEGNAAGSAQTTAEDYARFLVAIMAGEGLSAEMREALFTPQVQTEHVRMFGPLSQVPAPPGADLPSWGLGWGLVESDHGRAFFHTGNDRGAANYHVGFPEQGLAVVLLGSSQTLERAAPALTRLIVGDVWSPYEFLGYEPFDAPRGRLVAAIAEGGLSAGRVTRASISDDEVRRWHPEDWALWDSVGQDLAGLGHAEAAAELYTAFVRDYPEREFGHDRLGTALVGASRYADARAAFTEGLGITEEDPFWSSLYSWKAAWAGALADPADVGEATLSEYAGVYDTRHVELGDGALWYYREGAPDPTPRRLFALDERTFVLEGSDSFRLRFDRDEDGTVFRVTGQYLDNDDDQTLRTPG